jgi:hypothetical protein
MPSATDTLTIEVGVKLDTWMLAKALRRLADLAETDADHLRDFTRSFAEDLHVEDEEVAHNFARWFAEAAAEWPVL